MIALAWSWTLFAVVAAGQVVGAGVAYWAGIHTERDRGRS